MSICENIVTEFNCFLHFSIYVCTEILLERVNVSLLAGVVFEGDNGLFSLSSLC